MTDLDALNEQFGTPQLIFKTGPGGLTTAEIETDEATAAVVLQGGHVLSFRPHGQRPVLWVSHHSYFTPGKAIRGGIPVCWPWFVFARGSPLSSSSLFSGFNLSAHPRGNILHKTTG